jgi:hypothetical protein
MPPTKSNIQEIVESSVSREVALQQCEGAISKGAEAFVAMGQALRRIRDERLYEGRYESFSEYCEKRWQWSRSQAYYLMSAAEAFSVIEESAPPILPVNPRQIRSIASVPNESKPAVWDRAIALADDAGVEEPTHKHVEAAVEEYKQAQPAEVVELRPAAPKPRPLTNEDILGTELEIARRRCQHLEAEIAAVLAEYGRDGRLSAETLERLEEQLLQPVPMEVVA